MSILEQSDDPLLAHIILPGKPVCYNRKIGKYGNWYTVEGGKKGRTRRDKWLAKISYARAVYVFPVYIEYKFIFVPPKSWPKGAREEAILYEHPVAVKPDLDNLIKFYNDVIKGIVIADDNQIVEYIKPRKVYGKEAKTEILIFRR